MPKTCTWAVLMLAGLLVACEFFPNAPESRAKRFLETLVTDPANLAVLNELALVEPNQTPEQRLEGLTAQVAVNYLRAKMTQGEKHDFSISVTRLKESGQRWVTITVRPNTAEAGGHDTIRFRVAMREIHERGWLVSSVRTEPSAQ